jgi:hypothetical protein
MGYYPPEIRSFLRFGRFQKAYSGDWLLTLPPFYADLFEEQEAELYERCIGWRQSNKSFMMYTYFKGIDEEDIQRIQEFRDDYGSYMLIGRTDWIESHFDEELDVCIALDKNYKSLTERTEIGELEYLAKWNRSEEAFSELTDYLLSAMDCASRFRATEQACLSYIPFNPEKAFDLPCELTKRLVRELQSEFWGGSEPILHPVLRIPKPSMKDVSLEQKFDYWKKIVDNHGIVISQNISGKTVFIIDDLYQSGVTIWSYAWFLKMMGADRVIGVVCVKAGKDTDNSSSDFG